MGFKILKTRKKIYIYKNTDLVSSLGQNLKNNIKTD